ncbi:MAG: DUF2505 domain-containing protein [Myxococcota bacterium]
MVKIHIEHVFPDITPKQFFALLVDPVYDNALKPALGVKARDELDRQEDDKTIRRRIRMVPGFPIPSAVKKAIGDKELEYIEESTLHKDALRLEWSVKPNIFPDKVTAKGVVLATAQGSGIRRVIEGEIKVDVFGVGGIIERAVKESVERSYEKASDFTLKWIRDGKLKDLKV